MQGGNFPNIDSLKCRTPLDNKISETTHLNPTTDFLRGQWAFKIDGELKRQTIRITLRDS